MNPHPAFFSAGALVLAVSALGAQSVSDSSLARCAKTRLAAERLRCYDQLARVTEAAPTKTRPASSAMTAGAWKVEEQTNPLDDSKTVFLALVAAEGRSGLLREPPTLVLRCKSGQVEAYIDWSNYMGSDASSVTSRIGSEPPVERSWGHSTDNRATFYPDDPVKLLEALLSVDRFVAQATPYSESPVTAVFLLRGLDKAIVPLREACDLKQ